MTDQSSSSILANFPAAFSLSASHFFTSVERVEQMYGSNSSTERCEKVCETIFRFRVCSARSRVLKSPLKMLTKAS